MWLAMLLGVAGAAAAQNQAPTEWIRFSGELRERAEAPGGSRFARGTDLYGLHRFRLGMELRPFRWFRVVSQLQDARAYAKSPALPPYQNTFDLRQAYAELGRAEADGFSLRAGRQEMNFGNGRLIGESWWTNVSRSFDGVRAIYRHGGNRVDVFAMSVVIVRDGVLDHHNQGNNLHGVYGSFTTWIPKATVEPYSLWRVQRDAATESGIGRLNQHTHGLRMIGKLPAGLDYRTEMAVQRGTLGRDRIQAWTGHWVLGETMLPTTTPVRVFLEYDYASGDQEAKDRVTQTFDPIYPSTHDKLGLADQFGWRNIRDARAGVEWRPAKKWSAASSFHDFWLASARDALYPTRGSIVARSADGKAGTHVGEELDFQAVYQFNGQTQLGIGYSHIFTGDFLNRASKGKDYNVPYLMISYVF